jgi:DNA-binding NarL/FixJ family response regulator
VQRGTRLLIGGGVPVASRRAIRPQSGTGIPAPRNDCMDSADPQAIALAPALIVEDDPAGQQRLRRLLLAHGLAPAGIEAADSIAAAQHACGATAFNLALVDIGLPDGSGLRLIEWMRVYAPLLTPIVVSAFGTEELIVSALRCGAHGYLLKERDDEELLASLRTIGQGGAPIDPIVARHILHLVGAPSATRVYAPATSAANEPEPEPEPALAHELTPRELEILGWVARGLISREIAQRLSRSPQTIECHIKNIFRKMSVTTRIEAVNKARERGLLH